MQREIWQRQIRRCSVEEFSFIFVISNGREDKQRRRDREERVVRSIAKAILQRTPIIYGRTCQLSAKAYVQTLV